MTNEKLTVNELFSGIGAQRKALERLGIPHEVVGICEIDKYAIQSYEAIFGATYNYGDICTAPRLEYADLWTYSFPCQDISVAGNQKGISEGTRSGLLYQVQRLLDVAKEEGTLPKYLLLENVKNLVGKKFKSQFDNWLFYLDQLGYNTYWQVLNAKNYGIPQNRERVFALSIRKDLGVGYEFPKPEVLTKRLADVLENEVDEKYYLKQSMVDYFIKNSLNNEEKGNGFRFKPHNPQNANVAFAVTTRAGARMDDNFVLNENLSDKPFFQFDKEGVVAVREATKKGYAEATIGDSINIEQPNSNTRRGRVGHGVAQTLTTAPQQVVVEKVIGASRGRNPENPSDRTVGAPTEQRLELNSQGVSNTITTVQKDNYVVENRIIQVGNIVSTGNWDNPQRGRIYSTEGLSPALNTVGGGGLEPKIVIGSNQKNAFIGDGSICSTLTSAMGMGGGHVPIVGFDNIRIRKLTPLECWRLMGFDDEDFHKAQQSGVSNSQLYKQAGNSIVVDVLEKIFKNIKRK